MAEHETSTVPAFPFIQTKEFMDMFGVTAESAYFSTPDAAESYCGNLLTRAKNWFKGETGWTFDSTETISEEKQTVMADIIYARAAYFTYLRISNLSEDKDHYRSLAKMQVEEFTKGMKKLRKHKNFSRWVTFPEKHTKEKILEA